MNPRLETGDRTRRALRAWIVLGALAAAASAGLWHAPGRSQPSGESQWAPVEMVDDVACVGANDLARLLGATKYWRPDLQKLVLRAGTHSIKLTADNPFVVIDDRAFVLPGPVVMRRGELQVPIGILEFAWTDTAGRRVRYDARARRLVLAARGAVVAPPQLAIAQGVTRFTLRTDDPDGVRVGSRGRSRFRLNLPGPFNATLPESLPASSLIRTMRVLPGAVGSVLEMQISPQATGFDLEPDTATSRVTLELTAAEAPGPDWQRFAPEMSPGPRPLRLVVIDPGHGGADPGVVAENGLKEKDLTLALARELRWQIMRRTRARVVLTRDADRSPSLGQRAEAANRARADLVLCLHFDGFLRPQARGITAYVPPATYASASEGDGRVAPVVLVPWRDAATRFAVPSRELAEELLNACELRGLGPTRLRETLPYALMGVNSPGVMLECGMLTSSADRQRLATPRGIADLASAIADALVSYQRMERR
jgi:N-acetylmuramoyl-L-alanine amidase